MDRVSLRQFQLKASKYLPKLPIILTQYKRDIAILSKIPIGTQTYRKSGKKTKIIHEGKEAFTLVGVEIVDDINGQSLGGMARTEYEPNAGTPPPPSKSLKDLGALPKEARPSMHSTIVYCPHCKEPCWREYANAHYMEKHEV